MQSHGCSMPVQLRLRLVAAKIRQLCLQIHTIKYAMMAAFGLIVFGRMIGKRRRIVGIP